VFSVKVALFEVEKDIKNPAEYRLIPGDEFLNNVVGTWRIKILVLFLFRFCYLSYI
jgi:hypothetical protein